MPISSNELKDWMLDKYVQIKPDTVVDVGPGAGTYSDLMRPHHRGTWKAIEAWGPYVSQFGLWEKYDHVVVSDVRHVDVFTVHFGPGLIIVGDCLEHMERDEAVHVLKRLQAWGDNILLSLPIGEYPQGAVDGNWFEIHRSTWSHADVLATLGDGVIDHVHGNVLSAFWWQAR